MVKIYCIKTCISIVVIINIVPTHSALPLATIMDNEKRQRLHLPSPTFPFSSVRTPFSRGRIRTTP